MGSGVFVIAGMAVFDGVGVGSGVSVGAALCEGVTGGSRVGSLFRFMAEKIRISRTTNQMTATAEMAERKKVSSLLFFHSSQMPSGGRRISAAHMSHSLSIMLSGFSS